MAEGIKENELFDIVKKNMELKDIDIVNYSPLTFAYIGDAVYEMVVRTVVVDASNKSVNKLHRESANLVKADAQAKIIMTLMCDLTEEETAVYKRGRNAKSYTKAKNATYADYRNATGFEALIGYLYLSNQTERMLSLIKKGIEILCDTKNLQRNLQ